MFKARNFIGGKRPALVFEELGSFDGGGTTSQVLTLSSKALGTATADRMVVVVNAGGRGSNVPQLSSMTIGGVGATIIQGGNLESTVWGHASLSYALVPTGTTGDFVFTYDTDEYSNNVGAWFSLKGYLQFDPISSFVATGNESPLAGVLDVLGGGCAIGNACVREGTEDHTWTGMTEFSTGGGGNGTYSTANIKPTVAEAARAISVSDAHTTDARALVAASWR